MLANCDYRYDWLAAALRTHHQLSQLLYMTQSYRAVKIYYLSIATEEIPFHYFDQLIRIYIFGSLDILKKVLFSYQKKKKKACFAL